MNYIKSKDLGDKPFYSLMGVSRIYMDYPPLEVVIKTFYSLMGVSIKEYTITIKAPQFATFYSLMGVSLLKTWTQRAETPCSFYSLMGVSCFYSPQSQNPYPVKHFLLPYGSFIHS